MMVILLGSARPGRASLAPPGDRCYPTVVPSSPGAGGSRHVGRVVDPGVRDDGDPEPDLQLTSDTAADPAATGESVEPSSSTEIPERAGEPLLARAQNADQQAPLEAPVHGCLDEIGRPERSDREFDLKSGRAKRAPLALLSTRGPHQLSPTLLAVFGTLIGVATVLSLIALMINIDRRRAAPIAQASPSSAPSGAHAAPAEPAPPIAKRARQKQALPWRIADAKGDPNLREIVGKVGTDPFINALTAAGVPEKEAYRVMTAMKGVRDFDKCGKSDRFAALVERGTTRLKAFEYAVSPEEIYQAREGDDGLLKGAKLDLKIERNQVTGALTYDGKNIEACAERAGFDLGLGHVLGLALQGHLALEELERGDRLRVIAQELTVLGEFSRYTGIEAVEVRPLNPKRELLRLYYFDEQSLRGYYDANGKSPYEGGFRKPIPGAAITSAFNPRRMHPILHKIMPHLGTDIGAPMGTPVGASAPGTVSYIGPGGPAGNLMKVMHDNGIETGYAHLSRYAVGLKVGDRVRRLQTVGYVGSTGRSTGPHLHFSAQRDGKFFDAETLNLDGMRVLNSEQREQFLAVVAKYNALLDAIALPTALPFSAPDPDKADSPAPVGSASSDPGLIEAPGEDSPGATPSASAAPPPGKPANNSVYLSDKELLKMQSATDEGEVSE